MTTINSIISGIKGKRVYFDTNVIIYYLEQLHPFYETVLPLFEGIGTGEIQAYTSEFTLTEILIKPMKENAIGLIQDIKDLLLDPDLFVLTQTHQELFIKAAQLGGQHGLRSADAIHFASAAENHCHYFVSNDKKFKSQQGVQVLIVNDYLLNSQDG
jgi:predicted nucleic acid-binding protein